MRNLPKRFEAEEQIIDRAVEILRSRTGAGQALDGVVPESVIRGDSERTQPVLPAVWVGDGEATLLESESTSITNYMIVDLVIQSEVKSLNPQEGGRYARKLAAVAADELVRDEDGKLNPSLGLSFVAGASINSSQRGPSPPNGSIFTHVTVIRVTYRSSR